MVNRDETSELVIERLRGEFLQRAAEQVTLLRRYLADGDAASLETFMREVHDLKGSGHSFGFPSLTLLALRLEDAAEGMAHEDFKDNARLVQHLDCIAKIVANGVEPQDAAVEAMLDDLTVA